MAAVAIHQFAECITCHAWSPDQTSNLSPTLSLSLAGIVLSLSVGIVQFRRFEVEVVRVFAHLLEMPCLFGDICSIRPSRAQIYIILIM
jgi:hypothetical protein